jgi:effector-binding domain-containing protein
VHVGQWPELGEAYAEVARWMAEHGVVSAGDPWETYLDGPEAPVHRTVLTFPCRESR